jgi:hypothetical protein
MSVQSYHAAKGLHKRFIHKGRGGRSQGSCRGE